MFDPQEFLSTSFDTTLDDKFIPVPAGDYVVTVGVDDKALEIAKGEKDGRPWARMIVRGTVLDLTGQLKQAMGREPRFSYDFFLDLTPEGKLDMAKQRNVRLGQVLSATQCNRPGFKLTDIKGKQMKARMTVKKNENTGAEYNEVSMVTAP
jgi:hypothetical protein